MTGAARRCPREGPDDESPERQQRRVRSFVLREGRLTPAQKRALDTLLPRYGVSAEDRLDPSVVFGRRAPVVLEIGFGDGEALATVAARHPGRDFLGIEVHRPGVGRLLQRLQRDRLDNVRVVCADAVEVLRDRIPPASLDRVNIFFPDPWPKKRHHKRRLIQPPFVELLARAIRPGGILHLATDWPEYAEHMRAVLARSRAFEPVDSAEAAGERPQTKFERRGERLGHRTRELVYRRGPEAG